MGGRKKRQAGAGLFPFPAPALFTRPRVAAGFAGLPARGEDAAMPSAYLCPDCPLGDCICCGRPYAGAPASLCARCADRRCVRCGAATAGNRTACLCGSCGVGDECVRCGGRD
jgi:hypothetical protein